MYSQILDRNLTITQKGGYLRGQKNQNGFKFVRGCKVEYLNVVGSFDKNNFKNRLLSRKVVIG